MSSDSWGLYKDGDLFMNIVDDDPLCVCVALGEVEERKENNTGHDYPQ